ncbi:hypothetical protein R6Q59_032570 [Mikania micrantha]
MGESQRKDELEEDAEDNLTATQDSLSPGMDNASDEVIADTGMGDIQDSLSPRMDNASEEVIADTGMGAQLGRSHPNQEINEEVGNTITVAESVGIHLTGHEKETCGVV